MKKSVIDRIARLREKVVGIQIKMVQVEKMSGYVDEENFKCYKNEIDKILEDLEISIIGVETAVERTYALAEEGWFFGGMGECEYFVAKELKEGSQRVNKKIKQIEDLFSLAVN